MPKITIKQSLIEDLKKEFGLKTITLHEFKDKYGLMVEIKELGSWCYKRNFEKHIKLIIEEHQYAMKKETLKKLRVVAKTDNKYAYFLGKREYEVVKVYTSVEPFLGFGALIKFKDNGELRYMYETGLHYLLSGHYEKNNPGKDWLDERQNRRYFTAGGIKDKDVDFIFHGVGFSTKVDMYNRTNEKIIEAD